METTTLKLYSLSYRSAKTYLAASLFIVGNVLLPQLCHLIPNGGMTLLPIYFFTLVGSYKYGWKAGLLIAIFSPLVNSALFGMPMPAVLPAILLKSVLLAGIAGIAAKRFQRISLPILALVVLSYQLIGTLGECFLSGSFFLAIQDFRIGIPGMLLQIIGGFLIIKHILKE